MGLHPFSMPEADPTIATAIARVEHAQSTEMRKPKEAAQCLEMLGQGCMPAEIMAATGLSFTQIASLRKRHKQTIEAHRERFAEDGVELAEKARLIANAKMDQLAGDPDELKKLNARDAALMYGIYQDKAFSAMGENKLVVQHEIRGVSLADAQKEIEAARAKLRTEAITIDVTPKD